MVAGLLKEEFTQVGHLCSVVLNYNPNNIKALSRRASAAIGLGKYELASWDLRLAYEVEPSNEEVVRKLKEVEKTLHAPSVKNHGKRKAKEIECGSGDSCNGRVEKGCDSNHIESKKVNCWENNHGDCKEFEGDVKKINVEEIDHDLGNDMTKDVDMRERGTNKEAGKKESESNPDVGKSSFYFRNKKKPGAALVISMRDYHLLAKGRKIQHFNPKIGITMSIRVIDATHETPKKTSESQAQHEPHSSPIQESECSHHRASFDNITQDTTYHDAGNISMEISPPDPEKVKIETPIEDAPMLPNDPLHTHHLE